MTYSYGSNGKWTRVHQIKLNGKQDNFTKEDIIQFGKYCNLLKKESINILNDTKEQFLQFDTLAEKFGVPQNLKETILANLRVNI